VVRTSDLQPIGCRFESGHSALFNDSGQVVHTHVPCLPSSINWYQQKLGAKQALHATHWPRVCGLAASAGVWLTATESAQEGL